MKRLNSGSFKTIFKHGLALIDGLYSCKHCPKVSWQPSPLSKQPRPRTRAKRWSNQIMKIFLKRKGHKELGLYPLHVFSGPTNNIAVLLYTHVQKAFIERNYGIAVRSWRYKEGKTVINITCWSNAQVRSSNYPDNFPDGFVNTRYLTKWKSTMFWLVLNLNLDESESAWTVNRGQR